MFSKFWGVFLLIHPFIYRVSLNMGNMPGKNLFFYSMTIVSCCLFGFGSERLALWKRIGFALLLTWGNLNLWDFLSQGPFHQVIFFSIGVLFLFHFYSHVKNVDFNFILNCLAIGGALQVVLGYANMKGFHLDQFWAEKIFSKFLNVEWKILNKSHMELAIGSLNHHNMTGAYIAMCFPAVLRRKWAWLSIVYAFGFYIYISDLPEMCVFGGVLYYFWTKKGLHFLPPYIAAALLMMTVFIMGTPGGENSFFSDTHRFRTWRDILQVAGVEFILKRIGEAILHPSTILEWGKQELIYLKTLFAGHGLGWFRDSYYLVAKHSGEHFRKEHNSTITGLLAFGGIGLTFLYAVFCSTIKKAREPLFMAGIFILFCNAFGFFPFYISCTVVIALIYTSACLGGVRLKRSLL